MTESNPYEPPAEMGKVIAPAVEARPKLMWYEHAWTALPFLLVAVGGAIGGACGGAAWAINQNVFRKTQNPVLRYVWTGLISAAAIMVYALIATGFVLLTRR